MPTNSDSVASAYRYCERLARRNRPYLYQVARYFQDREKYRAFCSTYASMRIIDDEIDSIPWRGRLSGSQRKRYISEVQNWLKKVIACQDGSPKRTPIFLALEDTFQKFAMPLFPWENLAQAMQKDVGKDSFATFREFLDYAEGAAIAPATVFMFLLTAKRDDTGYFWEYPPRQIYAFAKELALFCYLTHIIRDVSSDLRLSQSGLLYISEQDLKKFGLTKTDLNDFRRKKTVNGNFQKLAARYVARARSYQARGKRLLRNLNPNLEEDSRFALKLLLEFYSETLKKIVRLGYNVFSGREKLTLAEERKLTRRIARQCGFRLRNV